MGLEPTSPSSSGFTSFGSSLTLINISPEEFNDDEVTEMFRYEDLSTL